MDMFSLASYRIWPVLFFLAVASAFVGLPGFCEDKPFDDNYFGNAWDMEENHSGSTVTSIVQTPDGYMWAGTYDGLIRFDGVQSVTFDSQNTPELGHSRIQGLYLDSLGGLWINTFRGGLTLHRNGVFRREWPDQTGFDLRTSLVCSSSNQVTFVTQFGQVLKKSLADTNSQWAVLTPPANSRPIFQCADRDGTLWFLSRERGVIRFINGRYDQLPASCGLGGKQVFTVNIDSHGRIWAGAQNEIARWNGSLFEEMTPTNLDTPEQFEPTMIFPRSKDELWILSNGRLWKQVGRQLTAEVIQWRGLLGWASGRGMGAHEDSLGGIWFNHYGNGVFYITPNESFERLSMQNGLPGDRVSAWFQDREGGIWLGVDRGGLVRLSKRQFQLIGQAEGLPSCPTLSVCEEQSGKIWIGTAGGGLCSWRDGKLTNQAISSVISANFVFSIAPQTNGALWLSAGDGEDLFSFVNGKTERSPWGLHGVKSLLVDGQNRLWVGTKANIGWYSATSRHVFGTPDGVAGSAVRALAEAPDGAVWCGTDDGVLYSCGTNSVQAFQPDTVHARAIWSVFVDTDGIVWAGTSGGLLRFKDGRFTHFVNKQELPMDITQILGDKNGRLWLGTRHGICCVEKSALNAFADGKVETVDAVKYVNGLPIPECSDGYQPACWRTADGRLLFSTIKGVVSINPSGVYFNSLPPPVVIEDMHVDGGPVSLSDKKIIVAPGHEHFQFRFAALTFDAPDQARFRYRLDGLDKRWVEADTRRIAEYGHLAPNRYSFRVIACNGDGVWNKTGASVDFIVLPYFYETRWFQIVAGLMLLLGVAITVRSVVTRKYRIALSRLAQQHAIEQDRSRIAKNIHDDMGAGLTQISLLSELGRRAPIEATAQLERIYDVARDLTRAMDETVWAIDPQQDTLVSLMDYISAYSEDFLRAAEIRCRMDFPSELPTIAVAAELRYNLFLALKEVLNNIVKHAQASVVRLSLKLSPKTLTLLVEDNGRGFVMDGKAVSSADRINSGLGLTSLKERMESVGGAFVMRSQPGNGTRVELTIIVNTPKARVWNGNESGAV